MEPVIEKILQKYFDRPARCLDLGAGDFEDVNNLREIGWFVEGVELKTGTDLNMAYRSEKAPFDFVMSNFVLHFLDNQEQLIKTAWDNLKEGGIFLFQDLEKQDITGSKYLAAEDAKRLISRNGFQILSSKKYDYFDDKEGHKHWHVIVEIVAKKLNKETSR